MKRIQTYDYNKKILTCIQVLMLMVSSMLLLLLIFAAGKEQVGIFELMEKNITYNILYLLSMFDAICFFELIYFRKQLDKHECFEGVMLSLVMLCMAQLFLMNIIVGIALFIFIYNVKKTNSITLTSLYKTAMAKKNIALPAFQVIFFGSSILLIYTMINYQFI